MGFVYIQQKSEAPYYALNLTAGVVGSDRFSSTAARRHMILSFAGVIAALTLIGGLLYFKRSSFNWRMCCSASAELGFGCRVSGNGITPRTMTEHSKVESWMDLDVWRLSHSLVLRVYGITKTFPSDERFRLTDQLCRAAASIPTNIAEGKGRNALREYLHFLSIAKGSLEETKYLLLLAKDLGYVNSESFDELNEAYNQVAKMLNGLSKSLGLHLQPGGRNPKTPKDLMPNT